MEGCLEEGELRRGWSPEVEGLVVGGGGNVVIVVGDVDTHDPASLVAEHLRRRPVRMVPQLRKEVVVVAGVVMGV